MRIRRKLSVCLLAVFLCGCAGNAGPAQETAVSEPVGFDWDKLSELVEACQFSPALDLCDEYISQCADPSEDPDYEKIKEIIKSIELISDDPISIMYAYGTDLPDDTEYSVGYRIENKELNIEHYRTSRDTESDQPGSEATTVFDVMELTANDDGIIRKAYRADMHPEGPHDSETIEYYETGIRKKCEDVRHEDDVPDSSAGYSGEQFKITIEYDELGRITDGYKETDINTEGLPEYKFKCYKENPYIIELGYTGQAGDKSAQSLEIIYADDGSVDKLIHYDLRNSRKTPQDIPLLRDEAGRQIPDPEVIYDLRNYGRSYDFSYVLNPSMPAAVLDAKGRVIQTDNPFDRDSRHPIQLEYAKSETWESVLRNYKTIYSSYLDALNHNGNFYLLVNTSEDQKKAFEERYHLNEDYTFKLQKLEFDRNSYKAEFDEEGRHYSFTVRAVLESEHKETGKTEITGPVIDVKLDNIEGEYLLVSQQSSVNQDSSMQNFVPVTE